MAYWETPNYGTYAPWIQNNFPRDAWAVVCSYIHLVDNTAQRYTRGDVRYDPLFKLHSVMDNVMKSMQSF